MNRNDMILSGALCLSMGVLGCASDDAPADADASTGGEMETDSGDDPSGPSSGDPSGDPTSDGSTSGDPTSAGSTSDDPTSDGSTSGDPTSDGSTGEAIDDEPPTVISISPDDGENGVMPDAEIVITFSEPMDKVATQAAYQSSDIPAASAALSWNDAGDVLTITPNEPLALGEGYDPDEVEALTYQVAITTAARDLAGNELEENFVAEFATTRLILEMSLPLSEGLYGWIRQDGATTNATMAAGDSGEQNNQNAQYKGFMSFDLDTLPEGIQSFVAAEMRLYQTTCNGTPYEDLGNLRAYDIEFDSLDVTAFQAPSLAEVGVLSDDPAPGIRPIDVTSFVMEDYEAGRTQTQFRMEFDEATDLNQDVDRAVFSTTGTYPAALPILYTIP